MVILLDGPLAVGKTTVTEQIKNLLADYDIVVLDADEPIYKDFMMLGRKQDDYFGTKLMCHTTFCRNFGEEIDKQADLHEIVIVPMCLAQKQAKECIADYLKSNRNDVYHVVLYVSKDVLRTRAINDIEKDRDSSYAINEYDLWLQYYDLYYADSVITINTDDTSAKECAEIIRDDIIMTRL